jgi:predicted transposase/invertase (TIGR01784 family)
VLSYENSLKYYRDLKNSIDTAFDEGKAEGRAEQKIEIAREMLAEGEPMERVARLTGLAPAVVEELKRTS